MDPIGIAKFRPMLQCNVNTNLTVMPTDLRQYKVALISWNERPRFFGASAREGSMMEAEVNGTAIMTFERGNWNFLRGTDCGVPTHSSW